MLLSRIVDCSFGARQFTPVLVGFCVGISVCLIVTNVSTVEHPCKEDGRVAFNEEYADKSTIDSVPFEDSKSYQENTEDLSDYEPRINLAGKPHSAKKEPQTLIRPRYFSTELGIKDKCFVAVLSSIRQISAVGLAINKTVAHHVNRLAFFVEVAQNDKLDIKTLPIVGFKDSLQGLLTLHTLKYLADKLTSAYSFFFLIKDSTFVDGRKLDKLVKHISVSENVYMGIPTSDPTSNPSVCSLESGILLSGSVLRGVSPYLESCTNDFAFNSEDEKIGLCIYKALNLSCQSQVQGQEFSSFLLDEHANDAKELEQIWDSLPKLSRAMTVYHTRDSSMFYMLKKLSSAEALGEINNSIKELEQSILLMAPHSPGGIDSVAWPVGYAPPSKPETRFGVLNWKYFNETHMFFDTEFSVVRPMNHVHLEDVKEVINKTVVEIKRRQPELEFLRLVDGYKRFDPTRGMDYILNLMFSNPSGNVVRKRVEGCRPITHVDTVSMPYVTESSFVHLVMIISEEEEVGPATKFVNAFAKNMISKSDKSDLILMVPSWDFGNLRTLTQSLNAQYKKQGMKLSTVVYKAHGSKGLEFPAMDTLSNKLGPEALVFICNPFTELYPEVLNRVRINTISGWQVFSAIPFAEYNPEVSLVGMPRSEVLNISTNQGFYDMFDSQHISFYMADYVNARKTYGIVSNHGSQESSENVEYESILAMFTRGRQLHILRGVEPHLRVRYFERKCETYHCTESFLLSQGTRSQLAKFALGQQTQT